MNRPLQRDALEEIGIHAVNCFSVMIAVPVLIVGLFIGVTGIDHQMRTCQAKHKTAQWGQLPFQEDRSLIQSKYERRTHLERRREK